jgi:hypothetical protein
MTSMSEVYEGGVGAATSTRQRLLGGGLFVVGAATLVGAIPIATTDLAAEVGLGVYAARELAGVLAGLGLPAVFVGILVVLPAGRVTRAAAAIGAGVAVLGVGVFAAAYPYSWISNAPALAAAATAVYSGGTLVTFWCLFVGLATFKRRNDPGGTANLEITDEGTVRVVTDEDEPRESGSVGLFPSDLDGGAETQTGSGWTAGGPGPAAEDDDGTILADSPAPQSRQATGGDGEPDRAATASDGAGSVESGNGSPGPEARPDSAGADADIRSAVRHRGRPDEYCGNCAHFEYARADGEMVPYCGFHDGLLRDMDACEQWESNS